MDKGSSRNLKSSSNMERRGSGSREKSSKKEITIYPCGTCKNPVNGDDKGLQCGICQAWYHTKCQGISDAKYTVLIEDSIEDYPQMHWYCNNSCNKFASKYVSQLTTLESRVGRIEEGLSEVTDRIKKIEEGKMPQGLMEAVQEITEKTCTKHAAPQTSEDQAQTQTDEQMAEIESRLRRSKNLIVFKLQESASSPNASGQRKEDEKSISRILEELKTPINPVDVRRPGNRTPSDKNKTINPRPVRLTFNSEDDRNEVLKSFIKTEKKKKTNKQKNPEGRGWSFVFGDIYEERPDTIWVEKRGAPVQGTQNQTKNQNWWCI